VDSVHLFGCKRKLPWGGILSDQQIAELTAYLKTLK
jgi:hypothetical protein